MAEKNQTSPKNADRRQDQKPIATKPMHGRIIPVIRDFEISFSGMCAAVIAPSFGPASPVKLTTGGNIPTGTAVPPQSAPARTPVPGGNIPSRTRIPPPSPAGNVINVRSSDELLSLLDDANPGPGGKITIPPSKSASNSKNSNRIDAAARLNAGNRLNADRRAMDMRTASSSVMRRSPQ